LNPGPRARNASTIPLGHRGGGSTSLSWAVCASVHLVKPVTSLTMVP